VTRDLTINPDYAKYLMLKVHCELEMSDLFAAIKDTLIWISCCPKAATLRAKALKGIKQVIKVKPENLMDEKIQQVLQLRVNDKSSVNRENALDLIAQFITSSSKKELSTSSELRDKCLENYLPIVIDRASDKS